MDWVNLQTLWFGLIAVLWIGYFVLEGFDFGVGILQRVLARDDTERSQAFNAIGPVWDGNEVWLLTAGGATFAAFPEWYATLFSGFYLPLLLILVALIVRGVAFEFRHQRHEAAWTRRWEAALFWGSLVPAVLWGVAFANMVRGVPIRDRVVTGGLLDLLGPYALLGGLTSLALFTLHGAVFLAMKVDGDLAERSRALAQRLALVTPPVVFAFLGWTYLNARALGDTGVVPSWVPLATVAAAALPEWLLRERQLGWSFVATAATIAGITATLFLNLYPRVLVSTFGPDEDLTIFNAASTDATLTLMAIAALVFVPVILAYQGWTYWVFRERVRADRVSGPSDGPVDVLGRVLTGAPHPGVDGPPEGRADDAGGDRADTPP